MDLMERNDDMWARFSAAALDDLERVQALTNESNVNEGDGADWTVLHHAACHNGINVVKWLCKETGVNVNQRKYLGETPLMQACRSRNEEVVRVLLDAKADVHLVNDVKRSAMYFATMESGPFELKKREIVRMLLEAGAGFADIEPPQWALDEALSVETRRRRCQDVVCMLMLFRCSRSAKSPVLGGFSKDVTLLVARMLWNTRKSDWWEN